MELERSMFIYDVNRNRYRTINGYCNNLKNPKWGAQLTPYGRLIPANFDDGEFDSRKVKDKFLNSTLSFDVQVVEIHD